MQPVPQPRVTMSLQIENERFLEQLFRDCKEQLGMDHGITIDVFFVLFDLLISMCARARGLRCDARKLSHPAHVPLGQDRLSSAARLACH